MERIIRLIKEILKLMLEGNIDPHEDKDVIVKRLASIGFDIPTIEGTLGFFFSNYTGVNGIKDNIPRLFHIGEDRNLTYRAKGFLYGLYLSGYISINILEDILEIVRLSENEMDVNDIVNIMDRIMGFKNYDGDTFLSLYLN